MSSNAINVDSKGVRAEVRLTIEKMLADAQTADEKKVVNAKLGDVSLVAQAARAGKAVVVPMGWDENQQALWALLKRYHGI